MTSSGDFPQCGRREVESITRQGHEIPTIVAAILQKKHQEKETQNRGPSPASSSVVFKPQQDATFLGRILHDDLGVVPGCIKAGRRRVRTTQQMEHGLAPNILCVIS